MTEGRGGVVCAEAGGDQSESSSSSAACLAGLARFAARLDFSRAPPESSCKGRFRGGSGPGDADVAWSLSLLLSSSSSLAAAFSGELLAGFWLADPLAVVVLGVKKLLSEACFFSGGFEEPAMASWACGFAGAGADRWRARCDVTRVECPSNAPLGNARARKFGDAPANAFPRLDSENANSRDASCAPSLWLRRLGTRHFQIHRRFCHELTLISHHTNTNTCSPGS